VSVHEERRTVAADPPDEVGTALVCALRYSGKGVVADAWRDGEVLHLQPEPLQFPLDDLLGLLLTADCARCGDEPLEQGERVLGARFDLGVQSVDVQAALPKMVECLGQRPLDRTPVPSSAPEVAHG
jgi:hypothetical protein